MWQDLLYKCDWKVARRMCIFISSSMIRLNGDIWTRTAGPLRSGSLLVPTKTKAHRTPREAWLEGPQESRGFFGNAVADMGANNAADQAAIVSIKAEWVEGNINLACGMLGRIVSVESLVKNCYLDNDINSFILGALAEQSSKDHFDCLSQRIATRGHCIRRVANFSAASIVL